MSWIDQLERKHRGKGIPNLMKIIVFGQVAVWLTVMLLNASVYNMLTLTRYGLMHFQVWRLVTFLFVPPLTRSPLILALQLYLYYAIGTSLERTWGTFRFNLYYLLGMVGAILSCMLTGYGSNEALNLSLFFAFAVLYPETQFLLFYIIPIKVKWLGVIAAVMYLLDFVVGSLPVKMSLIFGLLNFLLFFWPDLKNQWRNYQRRKQWNDAFRQ